ncbi:Regulator of phospholipase D SRF1 [Lasiodiplodia hormozganensis]|uniref:Regulator of phospholipase D SRF1 n=1 Tax=Lasiodiplodia hormozganensis TaxID=869390 RepID=A0AA39Y2A6_9PEZI|nr:Regulator of phospholipase D SRF1 [Lasiodiplodia hormozganensis]
MASDHETPRTVPPWVRSAHNDSSDELRLDTQVTPLLLPKTPQTARPASHNSHPSPRPGAPAGRRFDHAREAAPPLPNLSPVETASRWRAFALASKYPDPPQSSAQREVASPEWIRDNFNDLDSPWEPDEATKTDLEKQPGFWLFSHSKRKSRLRKIHRILMRNPYIPLVIRLVVLTFSAAALGISGRIFHLTNRSDCDAGSSTYMAIIVDVIAIVYLCYITYDEYTAQPLGLRNPKSKLRLIFLDLLFIVFDSANLSIAFQSLTDSSWACVDNTERDDPEVRTCYQSSVCDQQKSLTAVLLLALVAWLLTFAISTLRIVERVTR